MKHKNGEKLSDDELIKTALDHMAEALCFLFETQDREGQALAFMLDSAIKYGTVVLAGGDVLDASADFTRWEKNRRNYRIEL